MARWAARRDFRRSPRAARTPQAKSSRPAATIGASLYVIPVIAIVAGGVLLGETVTLTAIMGGLLILGGVAVAQFGQRFIS